MDRVHPVPAQYDLVSTQARDQVVAAQINDRPTRRRSRQGLHLRKLVAFDIQFHHAVVAQHRVRAVLQADVVRTQSAQDRVVAIPGHGDHVTAGRPANTRCYQRVRRFVLLRPACSRLPQRNVGHQAVVAQHRMVARPQQVDRVRSVSA